MIPRVSVILPTYNRAALLPAAITSVMGQSETDWELIVADDGSTDGTAAYLRTIQDPRVRVLSLSHVGHPEGVRNIALRYVRAEYVAFLDSDDWWDPDKLRAQLAEFASQPQCGWSYTSFRFVDAAGDEVSFIRAPDRLPGGMIAEGIVSGEIPIVTSTVMARTTLVAALGGFDENLAIASDMDLWARLAERSAAIAVVRMLTIRRLHSGHYTDALRGQREAFEPVFDKLLARATTARTRRLIHRRRARWLVSFANERRGERRYGASWSALRAALPEGARLTGWWTSLAKNLLHPFLPGPVLAVFRRRAGGAGR